MHEILNKINRNKQWLILSLISTFIWGLLAHSYCFMHDSFSHDSLSEFNAAVLGNDSKIMLGRSLAPVYKAVFRSDLILPWMIGVLTLLWIALSVFLVFRIFHVESRFYAFLIAGIFTVNITVSATAATYLHDCDCNMFSLLCAVAAIYFWKNVHWGEIAGAMLIAISLGIYQGYITVGIVLVMFVCILELLNQKSFRHVFVKGLKAIGMFLVGGVLYFIIVRASLIITHLPLWTGDYNSLDNTLKLTPSSFLHLTLQAYKDCFTRLLNMVSPYPQWLVKSVTLLLALISVFAIIAGLRNKRLGVGEKLLCIVLVILLPLGMNFIYVLSNGVTHDLMVYAIWLFYLLALLLADWLTKHTTDWKWKEKSNQIIKYISMALVFVLLYSNVQAANTMYLKKDMEQDAFLSLMTRIVYRIEDYDEYKSGETPIVLVGLSDQLIDVIPGFEDYRGIAGLSEIETADTRYQYRVELYFTYVLANPAIIANEEIWNAMQTDPRVADMPSYPADESLKMIDDVLVVKLG